MKTKTKLERTIHKLVIMSMVIMVGLLYSVAPFSAGASKEDAAISSDIDSDTEGAFKEDKVIKLKDKEHLENVIASHWDDLDDVASGSSNVPRIFCTNFPCDFKKIHDRKDHFIQILLPIILKENEKISRDRAELVKLKAIVDDGGELSVAQASWVNGIAEQYRMADWNFDGLLRRVDIIPASLALGQAVVESGWGVSYAAIKKNSPFGITVRNSVLKYDGLVDSVHKYMRNLNYNNAYEKMRQTRAKLRNSNKGIDGHTLIGDLNNYSVQRGVYIGKVRSAIKQNDLFKFDTAALSPSKAAVQTAQGQDKSKKA